MKKLNEVRVGILKIPVTRIIMLFICDLIALLLSTILPLYIRYDFKFMDIDRLYWDTAIGLYFYNVILTLVIFNIFKLYKSVWRYASDTELVNNAIAVILCAIMQPIMAWIQGVRMPISYPFIYGFCLMLFTCGIRFSYRILRVLQTRRMSHVNTLTRSNCMIVGAGAAEIGRAHV